MAHLPGTGVTPGFTPFRKILVRSDCDAKPKREFTDFLDQEIARLGKVRQQLVDLRRLYEGKEDSLPGAPAAMATSTEDMIVRVVENAHLALTREEVRDGVQRDYGGLGL